jgi:hypothetical protein
VPIRDSLQKRIEGVGQKSKKPFYHRRKSACGNSRNQTANTHRSQQQNTRQNTSRWLLCLGVFGNSYYRKKQGNKTSVNKKTKLTKN